MQIVICRNHVILTSFLFHQNCDRDEDENHADGWQDGECFSKNQNAENNGCERFESTEDGSFGTANKSNGTRGEDEGNDRWENA